MRIKLKMVTKIWVLLLWAQTLTFVKCQASTCEIPNFENAEIVRGEQQSYTDGNKVMYRCLVQKSYTATCEQGTWTENSACSVSDYCEKLQDAKLTVKSTMVKERYNPGEVIEYVCNAPGTIYGGTAKCVNSNWIKTVECPALSCEVVLTTGLKIKGFPPRNNRATAGQKLKFFCPETHYIDGSEETECLETGQWTEPFPTCSEKCLIPEIPDDLRIPPSVYYWSKGESIIFECRQRGYFPEGNEKIECLGNGQWSGVPPTCKKKCQVPTLTGNLRIHPAVQGLTVHVGQILTFVCSNDGFSIQGNSKIECLEDGQWNGPPPTCEGSICRDPPPLENGDTVEINKPEYEPNERVQYMCQNRYTMQGGPYKTCTRGVWTGEIKCLKPCTVDTEEMNRRNIKFAYGYEGKLYLPHNDHVTFACKSWRQRSSDPMRIKCIDGVINMPTCQ